MFWVVTSFFGTLLSLGLTFVMFGIIPVGVAFIACAFLLWCYMMRLA